jgi:hypothetical protein
MFDKRGVVQQPEIGRAKLGALEAAVLAGAEKGNRARPAAFDAQAGVNSRGAEQLDGASFGWHDSAHVMPPPKTCNARNTLHQNGNGGDAGVGIKAGPVLGRLWPATPAAWESGRSGSGASAPNRNKWN